MPGALFPDGGQLRPGAMLRHPVLCGGKPAARPVLPPGLLENRGVGELLVEYLARREVTPVQLEDILVELLP